MRNQVVPLSWMVEKFYVQGSIKGEASPKDKFELYRWGEKEEEIVTIYKFELWKVFSSSQWPHKKIQKMFCNNQSNAILLKAPADTT